MRGKRNVKETGERGEEEEKARDGRGSIKESTLRYNKVHPWKPSALFAPALLALLSWQQQHYAIQLTLFLNFINFSLGLGGTATPTTRRLRWLYRESSHWG